jgi:hypothetical protein
MREFTCQCEWLYVVGKRKVYGPIFVDDISAVCAHMMTREDFDEEYPHCARVFEKGLKG